MRSLFFFFVVSIISIYNSLFSQYNYTFTADILNEQDDSLYSDQMVRVIEQSLALYYEEYARSYDQSYEQVIDSLNYSEGKVVEFSDKIYCERLQQINSMSPIPIDCNEATLSTIRFFATKRRGFIRLVLGRSALYFDLYESKLSEYGLPLELKYLSVIESGLRPQVKSRAGALGLWQFMYRTGKMFGLHESSYIDERMDPEKSTDAACRYLKHLHSLYGDWNLALAAYNAGPGNVNKAIRRSGNKTTYWEIRPFLPRETQGYIPNFIAAMYMLKYHAQHNIIPAESPLHYVQLDTMCLSQGVHISTISNLLQYDSLEIKLLNPVYKSNFIPSTNPNQCISLPIQYVGQLVSLEDTLYKLERTLYAHPQTTNIAIRTIDSLSQSQTIIYHEVQSGEVLATIAQKYNTTTQQVMRSNNLNSSNIYAGQRLKIEINNPTRSSNQTVPAPLSASVKYYTVKSGDTFGKIAQKHGKTISQLKKLNPSINIDKLRLGQKIRIR